MNKYFLLIGFFCLFNFLSAQTLTINGNIVIQGSSAETAKIIISKNDIKVDEQIPNKRGHFEIKLALGSDYKLSFQQAGYITKIVNINTEVPDEIVETNPDFPPVTLIMNLLPVAEGIDIALFDQPIAILTYNYEVDDFIFDKEYSDRIKPRVAQIEQEIKKQLSARSTAIVEQERKFAAFITKGQQAFDQQDWTTAIDSWASALKIKPEQKEIEQKIEIARKEVEKQKLFAQREADYQKAINLADQEFNAQNYEKAITGYQQALQVKSDELYPKNKISKAELAIAEKQKQLAAETEQKRIEAEKEKLLRSKYDQLIVEADYAFKIENYTLSRLRYSEADQLKSGEEYPKKQIQAIDHIIHSAKYKTKLTEYNKNKTLAGKNMQEKKYAAAKVYYQKALDLLSIDKDDILQNISEIDRQIEAERLAAIEKEYKTCIEKADKAYNDKAFAIAKFYYQKALEIKISDKYATNRLKEVEQNISERKEKQVEL